MFSILFVGRHCCLWCTVTYPHLQEPLSVRGRSSQRSLATLEGHYNDFLTKGEGNIGKAKDFYNVIRPPLLEIPLDLVKGILANKYNYSPSACQVCPPGLHISLGIYDRLWELLEAACTELDLLLAKYTSAGGLDNSFEEYVSALRKREELNSKLTAAEGRVRALDEQVTFFSLHTPNAAVNQQLKILREATSKALLGVAGVVNNKSTKVK